MLKYIYIFRRTCVPVWRVTKVSVQEFMCQVVHETNIMCEEWDGVPVW